MPLTFESMRTPKPTPIVMVWQGQDVHLTYDRNACTMEITENISAMPIRRRLSKLLMEWDVQKAGKPWNPLPKDDPSWDAVALSRRVPQTETEQANSTTEPVSFEERERAYTDAWDAILLQLDRNFVRAVDAEVLDDFLGVIWRRGISANGLAPISGTAGSPGGTST